ncbi:MULTISPECIES: SMa0974 family conjugal transfer regulator [Agrobacterium]|uniref:SMa0974 family conjugal transfer regulator n=1 Tax=Agrobacterium TaxID=357 RepID=UPI0022CD05CA|nr:MULTISPECIES: DUF2218 domain-containing protein [Agrobacterium]MCZ7866237.1 DUF2218 domain-containing protein [Agrobacterium salinitolerans]MDA5639240.1 DUF2218 domain-containing protein [Agrobacterium sp. ST15.13.013]MDA6999285.1 DUF2218 domain-containing protein [Agrobacterium salinitolerans]
MAKHISETFVSIPDPDRTRDLLCATLRGWSFSITNNHSERLLAFDSGRAIITRAVGGLHLHVEAKDPLTRLGMQSVLQAAFSLVPAHQILKLEWNLVVASHQSDRPPERERPQRIR